MPSDAITIDSAAHNTAGPLGVSVRAPVIPGAAEFVEAAGIPKGDYNGRERGGAHGVVSLFQTTTRDGKRSSTYHAFIEGEAEARDNLAIITQAHVQQVVIADTDAGPRATGIIYIDADGTRHELHAAREVMLRAGSIRSPHLLLLSGIGPRDELAGCRRGLSRAFAPRRQAPEGSCACGAVFSGAGCRGVDDRDRPVAWRRCAPGAGRAIAR